ncbi:Uncharacterised protein [Mycobacterium tuberculosis]|nr:Uncharacterised protein [Mycobacterium tuberculosis]
MPIKAHTCSSSALASSLKPRGRRLRPSTCSAGPGNLGPVNICRAVERPIPVVATTGSKILSLPLPITDDNNNEAIRGDRSAARRQATIALHTPSARAMSLIRR